MYRTSVLYIVHYNIFTIPYPEADKFGQLYLPYKTEYMATSSFVLGCSRRKNSKNLENPRNILMKVGRKK
jgi:hypothetical protein